MSDFISSLIGALLGSGIVVAIIDWVRTSRFERRSREISFLKDQIQYLYGPLQFFTVQNKNLFDLSDKIMNAGREEFDGENLPNQSEDIKQTIEVSNSYVLMSVDNSEAIVKILRNNYPYIDPDDEEIFGQMVVDFVRRKAERDDSGRLKTPLQIYYRVGEISFMRPEFIDRVNYKFHIKKSRLDKLTNTIKR